MSRQRVVITLYRELLRRTYNTDYAKTLQAVTRKYMHETDSRIIDYQIQFGIDSLIQTNQMWFKRTQKYKTSH